MSSVSPAAGVTRRCNAALRWSDSVLQVPVESTLRDDEEYSGLMVYLKRLDGNHATVEKRGCADLSGCVLQIGLWSRKGRATRSPKRNDCITGNAGFLPSGFFRPWSLWWWSS